MCTKVDVGERDNNKKLFNSRSIMFNTNNINSGFTFTCKEKYVVICIRGYGCHGAKS